MARAVVEKRGESLGWKGKEVEAISVVAPQDVERAAVMWRSNAPEKARDLLDARTE